MANMSYCRFHNTLLDLLDCQEALQDEEPLKEGSEEHRAMLHLIEVCREIVDNIDAAETDYLNNN